MNYDIFERTVLGYGQRMSHQAEQRRVLHPAPVGRQVASSRPVRFQLAVALRNLADHLEPVTGHAA